MHIEVHPASRFEARACPPPSRRVKSSMGLLFWHEHIFGHSWIAVPEYNVVVVVCWNWLFVLVSSVLLLALATATAVAPRGHSYWTKAPLLHQLCRLISLRTSQLAGIVRFGTLSDKNIIKIIYFPFVLFFFVFTLVLNKYSQQRTMLPLLPPFLVLIRRLGCSLVESLLFPVGCLLQFLYFYFELSHYNSFVDC